MRIVFYIYIIPVIGHSREDRPEPLPGGYRYSTGGKQKLYGISKRGNVYLRRMLIHGARSVLFRVKYDPEDSGSGCIGWRSGLRTTRL